MDKTQTMHGSDGETTPMLSIVVPLYREEGNVDVLLKRLKAVLDPCDLSYEIILVDDGSADSTWHNICEAAKNESRLIGLKLSRNFGHQHALLAGLSRAKGQAIVTMDGDLQHPPELIPVLLAQWQAGYEVVNTVRCDEEITSFFKRATSTLFYRVFSALTDVIMTKGSSDFRLLDRKVLQELLRFQDYDLFLRGAFQWLGYRTISVSFHVEHRLSGVSKYTIKKMLGFAAGAIISFSTKPLRLAIWLGIGTAFLAFTELIYIIFRYFQGATVPGWASTVGVLSLLFGILFIILGIIGVYLARIHMILQARPKFIISEHISADDQSREMT